jgi:hypothetical protein
MFANHDEKQLKHRSKTAETFHHASETSKATRFRKTDATFRKKCLQHFRT